MKKILKFLKSTTKYLDIKISHKKLTEASTKNKMVKDTEKLTKMVKQLCI